MKVYGLIGHPLSHSFSKRYFSDKFENLGISNCGYELFDLKNIEEVNKLKSNIELHGFNVTTPYKEDVIPHMDDLDESAKMVGAVNVVRRVNGNQWVGYNSDYYGFKVSLEKWMPIQMVKALVLGTGGASKAVIAALKNLDIEYGVVSRSAKNADFTYEKLRENKSIIPEYKLIINTTPLGMHPNIRSSPDIDYNLLSEQHFLYDLVYNPEETEFLKKGRVKGCKTKNGLEMLELQAEKSWEIWNTTD